MVNFLLKSEFYPDFDGGVLRKMESPGSTPARASATVFLFYSTFEELSRFQVASFARPALRIRIETWHSMDCSHCAFHYDGSIFSLEQS